MPRPASLAWRKAHFLRRAPCLPNAGGPRQGSRPGCCDASPNSRNEPPPDQILMGVVSDAGSDIRSPIGSDALVGVGCDRPAQEGPADAPLKSHPQTSATLGRICSLNWPVRDLGPACFLEGHRGHLRHFYSIASPLNTPSMQTCGRHDSSFRGCRPRSVMLSAAVRHFQ